MKLYELPRHTLFRAENGSLLNYPDSPVYRLAHIDGMYSVCHDMNNLVTHWAVFTPVVPVKDIG